MKTASSSDLDFSMPPYRLPYEEMNLSAGVGIVGLHWVMHCIALPAYRAARFKIRQAAEIKQERIDEAVAHGFPAEDITRDLDEVIGNPDIQVIDSPFGHRRDGMERRLALLEACARNGKHLLMQKPVAHDIGTAVSMAETAREAAIFLGVNQNCRFNPAAMTIRHLLQSDRLGSPSVIELGQYWSSRARMPEPSDVHAAIDHTIHHVDLIRWWVDSPCVKVFASSRSETTIAIYEFENGVIARHTENHSGTRPHDNEIRVMTERGTIIAGHNWDWHDALATQFDFVHLYTGRGVDPVNFPLPRHLVEPHWHGCNPWEQAAGEAFYDVAAPVAGFMGTLGSMIDAAGTGKPPANRIEFAIESLRIALAAQYSARTGETVDPRTLPDDFVAEL